MKTWIKLLLLLAYKAIWMVKLDLRKKQMTGCDAVLSQSMLFELKENIVMKEKSTVFGKTSSSIQTNIHT